VDQYLPVTWDAVAPSAYAAPGQFVVNGPVAGIAMKAKANVRVTDVVLAAQNIARSTNALLPSTTASFSSSVPAGMLDGTTASGGWANKNNGGSTNVLVAAANAHPKDWVSLSWPNPQRINNSSVWFSLSTTGTMQTQLPATMVVSYWSGVAWVPVSNPVITLSAVTNTASTITFDPVSTTGLRLDMTSTSPMSLTTGNLAIAEWQVFADQVTYNTTASLTDLKVNGKTVPGFSPTTMSYSLINIGHAQTMPTITATAADNGRLLIVTPISLPGTATVTVTSEDGLTHATYSIYLQP
jgi:beta-galactosidase